MLSKSVINVTIKCVDDDVRYKGVIYHYAESVCIYTCVRNVRRYAHKRFHVLTSKLTVDVAM